MVSFEFLAVVVSLLGLAASITYYAIVLRNQNQTRQAQLYMDVYKTHFTKENQQDVIEMLRWNWESYDEFEEKYGVEGWIKFLSYMSQLEGLGHLVMKGFLDVNLIYDLQYASIILIWDKMFSLVVEARDRWDAPHTWEAVEYLYGEMVRIRDNRGHSRIEVGLATPNI